MDLVELAGDLGVGDSEAIDLMLDAMRTKRWVFHYLGRDARRPVAIYARREWPSLGYADVLILHSRLPGQAVFYRAPMRDEHGAALDVLSPAWVSCHYCGVVRWTVRFMLTVDAPSDDEHLSMRAAPAFCAIDPADRRPVTIRQTGEDISTPPGWSVHMDQVHDPNGVVVLSG